MDPRPTLTLIHSTHASLGGLKQSGLLDRHRRLLAEYSKVFRVVLYSCDETDYSTLLGVYHHPVPWLPRRFGWRHLAFYLWLVWKAPQMRGVIKVFGSNIPTLSFVKLLSRCPMVVSYQFDYANQTRMNDPAGLKHWLAPLLEKIAIAAADTVFVTAKWLEDKIGKAYHKRTVLVPNWVDFDAIAHTAPGEMREEKLILYCGRLHWSKGVAVLLDAFAGLKVAHPSARLVICGEGEERERLQNQVNALGVDAVEFRGRIPNSEVLRLMAISAVFVLPTLTMEGHPKALIEAMGCGAACVASDVPGNRETISQHETGLRVPPNDSQALASALNQLLGNRTLRSKLGERARTNSRQLDFKYVVSAEIAALLTLYKSRGCKARIARV